MFYTRQCAALVVASCAIVACGDDTQATTGGQGGTSVACDDILLLAQVISEGNVSVEALKQQVLDACNAIATDLGSLGAVDGETVELQLQQTCDYAVVGIDAFMGMSPATVQYGPIMCNPDTAAENACLAACDTADACANICAARGLLLVSCDLPTVSVVTADTTFATTLSTNLPAVLRANVYLSLYFAAGQHLSEAFLQLALAGVPPPGCDAAVASAGDGLGIFLDCIEAFASVVAVIGATR
jgi:hypothetical protein